MLFSFFNFFKYIGAPIQSLSEVKAQMMNGSAGSLSRTNSTSSVDKTEGKSSEKVHRRWESVELYGVFLFRAWMIQVSWYRYESLYLLYDMICIHVVSKYSNWFNLIVTLPVIWNGGFIKHIDTHISYDQYWFYGYFIPALFILHFLGQKIINLHLNQ